MRWSLSHRADKLALPLADRHYNRQKVGSPQFVPPGRCVVLLSHLEGEQRALWITSWPFAEYVRHAWAGAWVNSCFRNEGAGLSSELIREAVAATRTIWEPPPLGLITFVDASKTRHKRDPGRCYRKAGFIPARCPKHYPERVEKCRSCASRTAAGLHAFQLLPEAMPEPLAPWPLVEWVAPPPPLVEVAQALPAPSPAMVEPVVAKDGQVLLPWSLPASRRALPSR